MGRILKALLNQHSQSTNVTMDTMTAAGYKKHYSYPFLDHHKDTVSSF